jgi:hypothetical protein
VHEDSAITLADLKAAYAAEKLIKISTLPDVEGTDEKENYTPTGLSEFNGAIVMVDYYSDKKSGAQ